MLSVRLVTADSYQAQPVPQLDPIFSDFRGSEIKHVPIIRIFGSTSTGEKTCLHIHGIFPYLYVPYTGEEDPKSLAYRLAASLDAAINVSLGSASSNTQHVYLIQRVSGIPFYGYHKKEHQYLKIYFYNPAMIKRAADLLQNGSVLNQSLQPHEAHIPYILQFMIDYNVYGMSFINLSRVRHRRLAQTLAEFTSTGQSVDSDNSDIEYLPVTIERQSTCEIEIDAIAADIVNRREVESGLEFNPGLAAIWEEERARRVQAGFPGGDSQLVNPKSPPRPTYRLTDNDIYQDQRLARRLLMISQSDESTLSTTIHPSVTYAAEIREGESLLNSSYLPFSCQTAERNQLAGEENSMLHTTLLDSDAESSMHRMSQESSILGTDDLSLVNLLDQLADDGVENQESVDLDSLLGSQISGFLNDDKSDNENADDDDDDDDAIDLNLTSLQLDSMSSLEISTDKVNAALKRDRNPLSTDDNEVISPYEISSSSRSADEEKTIKTCRVPQYDGAGDVSPTLLDSDDEDNTKVTKEFSHLPEYNSNVDVASKSRKFNDFEQSLKTPLNNGLVASKVSNLSPIDNHIDETSVLPIHASNPYLPSYNGISYEPLDRLLEIGPEFVPDLEGLHSSMEIGILLSSADSDSPESVNEPLENDTIPLETVLNGDPCFTESAELDKSDLTELQDQYDSLRGNSLLPNVHTNLRIDNDLGNSSNLSDSDYQTNEKSCELMLNVRSPRSPITSRENSSSSENVAPNIQEPDAKIVSRGKFNSIYALNSDTLNCKDYAARMSTDNSDYNSNVVVATWAELQNLHFVDKDKKDGRSGKSTDKGQHSQGPRQIRRRTNRRSKERAASQILRFDSEKISDNAINSASFQVDYNSSLPPRKLVVSESPIKILTEVTSVETKLTDSSLDYVEEKSFEQLSIPHIAAEVEIELDPVFERSNIPRLNPCRESITCVENIENSSPIICSINDSENYTATVNFEDSPTNPLDKSSDPIKTKEFPEGFSYYSSERSHRDYTIHGIEHRHCMLSIKNKIVQNEVLSSDQVWVIQKRKRGRTLNSQPNTICESGDCAIPIVPLTKIDEKIDAATVARFENISACSNSLSDTNHLKTSENPTIASVIDTPVKNNHSSNYVVRKTSVREKQIDSSSAESSGNYTWSSSSVEEDEKNEPIDVVIQRNIKKFDDTDTTDCEDSKHNRYSAKKRYFDRRRSMVQNSKKINSSRTKMFLSRNRSRRVKSQTDKHEVRLPGIPGNPEFPSKTEKRDGFEMNVFKSHNVLVIDDKLADRPRKSADKLQSVVFLDCKSKQEISTPRLNRIVNGVHKTYANNRKNSIISMESRTFFSPPVSPIPKKKQSLRETPINLPQPLNRSSTPKKYSEFGESRKNKMNDCAALKLMISETTSEETRAKLKMLLKARKKRDVTCFEVKVRKTEQKLGNNEKIVSEMKSTIPILEENSKNLTIPVTIVETRDSIGNKGICDKIQIDKTAENTSIVTNVKICEPIVDSYRVIENTDIFNGSTLNTDLCNTVDDEVGEIFEDDREILGNTIDGGNSIDEVSNERKELSYRSDEFTSSIVEQDFFYGNNYTIDAVSQEMPACLFEEDSNSIDKRSPKKLIDDCLSNFNESSNAFDPYSEISVDPRDLDVYDVESLTPSSLATLDETTADFTVTSLNNSDTMESSFADSFNTSETQTTSTENKKFQNDSKNEQLDSSFEEASPAFEALSPRPKISHFGKPLVEEFTSHSAMEIVDNSTKINNSFAIDKNITASPKDKSAVEDAELDHEIQDLVSQVVVQFQNQPEYPCVIEMSDRLPTNIGEQNVSFAAGSDIQTNTAVKSSAISEREKITNCDAAGVFTNDNKTQSRVFKSQRKIQSIETLESKTVIRRLSFNREKNGVTIKATEKPNEVNNTNTQTKDCASTCNRLANLSKVPNKSSKLHSMSDTLVSIDLSRFEGFQPKFCNVPRIQNIKSTADEIDQEISSPNNLLKSTPLNVLKDMDETIVRSKPELKETVIVNDAKKVVISRLSTLNKTSGKGRNIEKVFLITTPIKIAERSESSRMSSSLETANVNLRKTENFANFISKESITPIKIPYVEDKMTNSVGFQPTKLHVISKKGKNIVSLIPLKFSKQIQIENTKVVENSNLIKKIEEPEKFDNLKPVKTIEESENTENPKRIEKSETNEKFESTKSFEKCENFKPIEAFEESENTEDPKLIEISEKNTKSKTPKPIEKSEELDTSENSKPVEEFKESENAENAKPFEKLETSENSNDTFEVESLPLKSPREFETFEKTIETETKQTPQNSPRKRIEKSFNSPERKSPRKCAEKTRRKLSQHKSSEPSNAESKQSSDEKVEIVADNFCQEPESSLLKKSDDLPSPNGFIPLSTKDLTNDLIQGNSMEKNNRENALESVTLTQSVDNENTETSIEVNKNSRESLPEISGLTEENSSGDELMSLIVTDENIKPATSLISGIVRGKSGRCVRPKTKLGSDPLFESIAQRRANISLDFTELPQQIKAVKTDQDNTCYHHQSRKKNAETNTEAVDLDLNNVNDALKAKSIISIEKLTPKSTSIDDNSPISDSTAETHSEIPETSAQKNGLTEISEANVPKVSTALGSLEESICDIAFKGIDIVSEKIEKQNEGENIFVNADNSCGQQIFLESLSSSKENLADIATEKIDHLSPIITEEKTRKSLPRRRKRRGIIPQYSRQNLSRKKNLLRNRKTNYQADTLSEIIESPVESSTIVAKKCQPQVTKASSDEESLSKTLTLLEKCVDNSVEKIVETFGISTSKLSRDADKEDVKVTNSENADISQLNISVLSPDKNLVVSTDTSSITSIKKRGRPAKNLITNVDKSSTEVKPSIAKNSRINKASNIEKFGEAPVINKKRNISDRSSDLHYQTASSNDTAENSAEEIFARNKNVNLFSNGVKRRLRRKENLQDNLLEGSEFSDESSTSQRKNHPKRTSKLNSTEPKLEINEIRLLGREDITTPTVSPQRRGRPKKKLASISPNRTSDNSNQDTAGTNSQESDILSQDSDEENALHRLSLPKKIVRRRRRIKYWTSSKRKNSERRKKLITESSKDDAATKIVEVFEVLPQEIKFIKAELTNAKKNCRPVRKASRETLIVEKSDADTEVKTLEVSDALSQKTTDRTFDVEIINTKRKSRHTRRTASQESVTGDQDIVRKTFEESVTSMPKSSDQIIGTESPKIKKNRRPSKQTSSQELIGEKNNSNILKESKASLSQEIAEETISDKSINIREKTSGLAVDGLSEDLPIEEKVSQTIKLSHRRLVEVDVELKSLRTFRRSGRSVKNQENSAKETPAKIENKTQSKESPETENCDESGENPAKKTPVKIKNKTQSEETPEAEISDESGEAALKISDKPVAEDILSRAENTDETSEMQSIVRPRKRVRFNENSSLLDEKIDKSPPTKHRKQSQNLKSNKKTVNTRIRGTTEDVENLQKDEKIFESQAINVVTEDCESTLNSSDTNSLDSLSLDIRLARMKQAIEDKISTTFSVPLKHEENLAKLQQPKIILKKLNPETLKEYGIKYSSRKKKFVKHHLDPDYEVPAYDGAADLSSSESDDEQADVTITREEKRVCTYNSTKKSTTNTRQEAIFTPHKRKTDDTEESQTPTRKSRALSTPGTSSKTPYRSPSRTSMLKSPGCVSGFYPRLQIIVTSPKVRKESSESRNIDARLENCDVATSSDGCLTPRRKNPERLHESVLRRTSTMKLPKNDIGDIRAPISMTGSQRPGELDEIISSEQSERNTLGITSQCRDIIPNKNLSATIRDGKDARKKLVFSIADDQPSKTHETPIAARLKSANLQKSGEPDELFPSNNDAGKSLKIRENLALHEIIDPQPGPSRLCEVAEDDNQLYDAITDEESDSDDDAFNVTFTQYIDSEIEKNQVYTLDRTKIGAVSNTIVSLRPKFNPPCRQRIVDTMETYGIPKYRNQEPFFSDETDVPKQKELAQKMLKVPGKGLKDLPAFVSSLENVTGLARWRKMKINEYQPSLAKAKGLTMIRSLVGEARVSLTPLRKPPTQKDVKNWLRAREYLRKMKTRQEEMARKTEELQKIEVNASIGKTEDDEYDSSDLDVTVIEASPEKIITNDDSEKSWNRTLRKKLAVKGLVKKAEELEKSEFTISEIVGTKDSIVSSGSGDEKLNNSNEMDASLFSVLQKSRLFKDQADSRQLGVSFGQIEFLSNSTRSNVSKENLQNARALTKYQYLTIMCLEVHVTTRGDLLPDAQHDSIAAIFYSVQSDVPPSSSIKPLEHGVIVLAEEDKAKNKMHYSYASTIPWSIYFANNEEALINSLVTLVTRTDPDILIGWELETLSWGYLFQRASRLGMDLSKKISRIPTSLRKWDAAPASDTESLADVKLPGRIVLDIWRIMRSEAALLSYTFESLMHHVLNERVPCPSFKILTDWWNLERCRASRWRVVEHYSLRVLGVFRILDHLDVIGRTSELARLFGIQFYEVFSRGSQFRVESVMLRLAKPLNYIPVSPSPMQRASMRAMEALPLILEPESMFYSDPLIVLDFQSLYPSIIIAHNYCFSTCLGRVEHIGQPQPFEFGAYSLRISKKTALNLRGRVNYAPCGVAFVKSDVRLGILPRMLTEILETRFMVKKAMKDHKKADKTLQRALHSRQHGLKYLANVTYGYTAANFSGRMPCIELGDSVISKSKETLERAIKLVEATPKWGARVVYGDTDSLFILVPGKSKAEAFIIGNEIADAVTASNLPPIKLRFEKVMYPSILQTKKRYCGYMYESPDQETPTYLAKGIETVRRDGCPAVSKILEKTLKILFETKDVSLVKKYVTRQLDKVLRGKVSIQDLTFAKEFRGFKGYSAKACVPALELTRRLMRKDPRALPRNNERVRYIIVAGAPNQALIHCVRTPWELINDPGLRPNAIYYVTRVIIPPLNRCLHLMGVDVNAWYREMPHRQILDNPVGQPVDKQKLTIFQYFGTIVCVSCGQPSSKGICMECLGHPSDTLVILHDRLRSFHRVYDQVTSICQSCVGQKDAADCSSLDCPVLYRRAQTHRELSQATHLRSIIECGNNLEF